MVQLLMSKTHHFKIKEQISQDASGMVFRSQDPSTGKRIALRKYVHLEDGGNKLQPGSALAYQVAIGRLTKVNHPSLRHILSGGSDSGDGTPFITARWLDADPLQFVLKDTYLSVEIATALLTQLLEVSELLSHILAEDGIWVETDAASISVTSEPNGTRFIFWASPLKTLGPRSAENDLKALIDLTEGIMGWNGREVDEREGGHLHAWLNWLKEDADRFDISIREVREMLAAAAGVEPPPPIAALVTECTRKLSLLEKWPSLTLPRFRSPKMPLFVFLSVLFVIEAGVGWLWLLKISRDMDEDLKRINRSIDDSPYIRPENDPDEPGSQPVDFTR